MDGLVHVTRGICGETTHPLGYYPGGGRPTLVGWCAYGDTVYVLSQNGFKNVVTPIYPKLGRVGASARVNYERDSDGHVERDWKVVYDTPALSIRFQDVPWNSGMEQPHPRIVYKPIELPLSTEKMPRIYGRDTVVKYKATIGYLIVYTAPHDARCFSLWIYKWGGPYYQYYQSIEQNEYLLLGEHVGMAHGTQVLIGQVGLFSLFADLYYGGFSVRTKYLDGFSDDTPVEITHDPYGLRINGKIFEAITWREFPYHAYAKGGDIYVVAYGAVYRYTTTIGRLAHVKLDINYADAITISMPNSDESVPFMIIDGWVYRWGINTGLLYRHLEW